MQMQTFSPHALAQAAMRVLRYGYFAPLQAAWLTTRRPGGYCRHLAALSRLEFRR